MKKTIVIGNIVILHAVDNGADRGVCGSGKFAERCNWYYCCWRCGRHH